MRYAVVAALALLALAVPGHAWELRQDAFPDPAGHPVYRGSDGTVMRQDAFPDPAGHPVYRLNDGMGRNLGTLRQNAFPDPAGHPVYRFDR